MKVTAKKYHPKGSMCASCLSKYLDCSNLNFKAMPAIKNKNDIGSVVIVKCTNFESHQSE